MLKIGDFSKLARVSVKTLRYYGQLGLLKPAWTDRFTSYRYYTLDQLPRLNRILALKDLGFSLEQIRRMLRDDLSAAELRGMMRMKHAELERHIDSEQARLARVEARLRQIEREGALPQYDVVLKSVPPQRVVGIRDVVPGYRDIVQLFDELRAYLRKHRVMLDATYPYTAIYYDAEYHDQGVDAEATAPLIRSMRGTARAIVHELPGVETMACVVHQGDYDGLPEAYNRLVAWVETNGFRVAGPNRDVFLQGPKLGLSEANLVTEVQFPVEKKPISVFVTQQKEKGEMEPKIVTKPAFTVVGLLLRGKSYDPKIPQLWDALMPRIGEIKHHGGWRESYGICRDLDPGHIEYVAGIPVTSAADIPEGMASCDVPEQTYAVFPCTLKTIHEAYEYAFETWLPGSGYERGDGPDFEHYDESFDPEVEGSHFHIYIPIKQRGAG